MKFIGKAVFLLALATPAAALADPVSRDPVQAPAGRYQLDKRHASLVVRIPHLGGFSRYTMRFNGLDGAFDYDPANWRATRATITVDPASIDTEDAKFNTAIAGFLGVADFPQITFVTRAVEGQGPQGRLIGDLTFHGVTRPVTLEATFNGVGPDMSGQGSRLGLSGRGRIKRSDFGVTAVSQFAGDDVDLEFEVEFVRK